MEKLMTNDCRRRMMCSGLETAFAPPYYKMDRIIIGCESIGEGKPNQDSKEPIDWCASPRSQHRRKQSQAHISTGRHRQHTLEAPDGRIAHYFLLLVARK